MDIRPLHTKIDKSIQTTHGVVVLESAEGFPKAESNLYCLSTDGKLIWQAEKPEPYTLYTRMKLNEENAATLSTYTSSGHACELNLGTGQILSKTSIQ